jgi:hypothetical protein
MGIGRHRTVFEYLRDSPRFGNGSDTIFGRELLCELLTDIFRVRLRRDQKRCKALLIDALEECRESIFKMLESDEVANEVSSRIRCAAQNLVRRGSSAGFREKLENNGRFS